MYFLPLAAKRSGRALLSLCLMCLFCSTLRASSHREAPLIANDPLADNTDVYAFRSPDDPTTITIIANYVPLQLPHGGPNYYNFGENIRYEIHIDNDASIPGDEIVYRFTFQLENEDPATFFNIRLGLQNIKATYMLERSTDGGMSFMPIVAKGIVPPYNIGPRSIESDVGLASDYMTLMSQAMITASSGERVFAGPVDDPFFVDLGGIFDLGDAPRQNGLPRDGVGCHNVSTIAIQIPISTLLKKGAPATPTSILDPDYVIGVWASASRRKIRTLSQGEEEHSGEWVQVSRLGMPLTNEAIIPIGKKDFWNALTPYDELNETMLDEFFYNPELALYMDDDLFGGAVPAFSPLRVQRNALNAFDFGNGNDGLFGLKGSTAVAGTALDLFGDLLLPGPGLPRSVDLWPIFHTGVPNVPPYQLATGKDGNPLATGKPFINNFLPNGGDMLRLNMAVPVTDRDDPNFSSLGLVQAAVLGLVDPAYNQSAELQFIPNMDGFPNGRRLEDDVTRIELQAVSGIVLAAIGLWYDDFIPGETASPVTPQLLGVLGYSTGVEQNDRPFQSSFPYMASPFRGTGPCGGPVSSNGKDEADLELSLTSKEKEFKIFHKINFTLTLENKGPEAVKNVVVKAALPEGTIFAGGKPDKGKFNLFFEQWGVDLLEAGATAELKITLLPLVRRTPITFYSEVLTSDKSDPDSSPGNGTPPEPNEDDEAAVTIQPKLSHLEQQTDLETNVAEPEMVTLYPNPSSVAVNVGFTSPVEEPSTVIVFDMSGKQVLKREIQLTKGYNTLDLNVEDFPNGTYLLRVPMGKIGTLQKKFVKSGN